MWRLGLVLCLLTLAAPASATYTIIVSGGHAADNSGSATSTAVDTTGSTLLVISCSWYSPVGTEAITASDSKSNTWTGLTAIHQVTMATQIFYVNSATPTVGSGHTFNCAGTTTYPVVGFVAASGGKAAPFDQQSNNWNSGVTSVTTGSISPTEDNELVIAAMTGDGSSSLTINGGFTTRSTTNISGGVTMSGGIATLVQTTGATAGPTWSWSGTSGATAVIASFKTAPAASACGQLMLVGVGSCLGGGMAGGGGGGGGDSLNYRPTYYGFGTNTVGGSGRNIGTPSTTIVEVTNLNNSGAGSLRACMEGTGARVCVFKTSGTLTLTSTISVTNPYLTVAGQTAPSPGFNIRDWGIYVDTHDVVIQHLRFRESLTAHSHGEATIVIGEGTPAEVAAYNIVIDHVSCAWTTYMCFSVYDIDGIISGPHNFPYHPYNVTFLDCLWAYGLSQDITYTGMGGGLGAPAADYGPDGSLAGGYPNVTGAAGLTMMRSLFVHNSHRQPISSTGRRWQVINNVVYGTGPSSADALYSGIMLYQAAGVGHDAADSASTQAVIIGNVLIPSTGSTGGGGGGGTLGSDGSTKMFYFNFNDTNIANQTTKVWLADNSGPGVTGTTGAGQRNGIAWGDGDRSAQNIWYASAPTWHTDMNMSIIATASLTTAVFAAAGARPLDRDNVDTTAIAAATNQNGARISAPSEIGGFQTLGVNSWTPTYPGSPNSLYTGSFRTNLEHWLEECALKVEVGGAHVCS